MDCVEAGRRLSTNHNSSTSGLPITLFSFFSHPSHPSLPLPLPLIFFLTSPFLLIPLTCIVPVHSLRSVALRGTTRLGLEFPRLFPEPRKLTPSSHRDPFEPPVILSLCLKPSLDALLVCQDYHLMHLFFSHYCDDRSRDTRPSSQLFRSLGELGPEIVIHLESEAVDLQSYHSSVRFGHTRLYSFLHTLSFLPSEALCLPLLCISRRLRPNIGPTTNSP